ncbi:HpcH/HpaI aldolase family protein [Falsirhodobacter sp. 1013]|uniref:HpcH/HpaI aldolase family protein n=1 Tax=Falsirhodobacter sp. 1013 TaxID=3417566 RepID=UPI003EBCD9FD
MTLRDRIVAGGRLRGTFLGIPSPAVTEIVCAAGPDFVCIDGEHSPIRGEALLNMLRAARVPALVRVAEALPHLIAEVLDAGAEGVLVPRVSSAEQAALAVRAARFPPAGQRGVGPGRAAGYGYRIAELIAARPPFVAIQIETPDAVLAVDDILATPGLDLAFIGPGDLGVGLAAAGHPMTLDAAIDTVIAAAEARGIPVGIFAPDRAQGDRWLARVPLVIQGSDAMILGAGSEAAFG